MIDSNNSLLPIAKDCIHLQEKDRLSSEELCQRLAGIKESREYQKSIKNHFDEIKAKDNQIVSQTQQLQEKDRMLRQRLDEITLQTKQLQQLCQQLDEQQQVAAEIRQTNHFLWRQVEQLQQQLSLKPSQPSHARQLQPKERESLKQIKLAVQPSLQVD